MPSVPYGRGILLCGLMLLVIPISGCRQIGVAMTRLSGPVEVRAQDEDDSRTVYVISNGFHAGLVLPQQHISPEVWPEHERGRPRRFVEVGWGDEGFYRAKKVTVPLIVDAMFPSPSVLHIVGFDPPVEECMPQADIVELSLTSEQFDGLCSYIHRSYEVHEGGLPIALGDGLYGQSQFFRAKGNYYFPRTCNVWTAEALRTAGLPVSPGLSLTADGVLWQVRRFGRTIHERP